MKTTSPLLFSRSNVESTFFASSFPLHYKPRAPSRAPYKISCRNLHVGSLTGQIRTHFQHMQGSESYFFVLILRTGKARTSLWLRGCTTPRVTALKTSSSGGDTTMRAPKVSSKHHHKPRANLKSRAPSPTSLSTIEASLLSDISD